MRRDVRSIVIRYAIAALAVGIAVELRLLLTPLLGNRYPFATIFLAVLVASWRGGFGPGLAATMLGGLACLFFFVEPAAGELVQRRAEQAGLILYICVGIGIASLGGRMREAREHAKFDANQAIHQRNILRTTLASIGDGVLTTDENGRVEFLNGVAETLTGWTAAEAAGRPIQDVFRIVNEQTEKLVENPVEKVLELGVIVGLANHTILIGKDGRRRPIDDSGAPIRGADGRLIGAVLVFRDVSEARRAEQARRRLAAIVESSDDAVISKNRDGIITSWNAGAERTYGYTVDEIVGKPFSLLVPPSREWEVEVCSRRLQAGERLAHFETLRRRRDGTLIDVSVSYSPMRNDEGELIGTAVITRDITNQKRADELTRAWDRQLQLISDHAPVMIAHCDSELRFKFVNRAYAEELGLTQSDIIGKPIIDVIGPAAFDTISPYVHQAFQGNSIEYEAEIPYRGAGAKHMHIAYQPEFNDEGKVVGYVAAMSNITERKRVEQALQDEARTTETLYRINCSLSAELDPSKIIQMVTDETTSLTGAEFGAFFHNVRSDDGESYMLYTLSGVPREKFEKFPMPRNTAIFEPTFRGDGVVRLDDVTEDPRFGKNAPYHGMPKGHLPVRSYLAVPVVSRTGEVLGGLFYGHSRPGIFAQRHEDLAVGVASQASVAIDNARLYSQLRDSEERFRLLTDALPALIAYVDRDRRFRLVNKQYEEWFGQPSSDIQGKSLRDVLGERAYALIQEDVDRALAGETVTSERSMPFERVGPRFVRASYVPHRVNNVIRGYFGLESDITELKRAEYDSRFLADASAALAGLVDYQSTLQKLARLAVPHFADWCAVDMLTEDGTLSRLAVAHADASKVELARDIHRRFPPDPESLQGIWKVIRTGQAEVVSEITDEMLAGSTQDPELLGILLQLGIRSYMGVPLRSRDRVVGALTFIGAESGRRYSQADLDVAEDLANRASVAIDNARLYHEVREADRRKDEFLAIVGHELRNPLAPISNALQIFKMPNANAQAMEKAREMMERQVHHMVRLVDDLLDISRIVRGKIELRRERADLGLVVSRAVETALPLIEGEGHRLEIRGDAIPIAVLGDPVRLSQAIANLLNNAARYTERGGAITVSYRRDGEWALITVADTGIGIAPEELTRIWQMFVQADRRMKGAHGGMGVGLALVKGLVELHGGSVDASSAGPGKGSQFIIRLPMVSIVAERATPTIPSFTGSAAKPKRVLVVDDNVDAAESLAMLLRLEGHEVDVANDGPAAIVTAVRQPPDLAFFDIGMPTMDGYELARRFRADPALRRTTLVALTGWGQAEDRRRTKEAGFDHHEVKPVAPETLDRILSA